MVGGSPGTPASDTTKTGRHDIAESGVKHQKSINHQSTYLHRSQMYLILKYQRN
jgi:hypothetical protein